MDAIENGARWVKYRLGLRDNSKLVVALRPTYNRFLEAFYGKRGLIRVLDGVESIRIQPAHRYFRDDFELPLFRFLRQAVHPGNIVLEVGANVGVFTIPMARWVGSEGHVFAFEPSPTARTSLEYHLALNGVTERVSVIPAAVSDVPGRSMFFELGSSGQNTLSTKHSRIPNARPIEVDVTTLDRFCESQGVVPSLIKIDIEGFELHALRGAKQTLRDYGPVLAVEVHPMNWPEIGTSRREMEDLLSVVGYSARAISGQVEPFSEYGYAVLEPTLARPE